MLPRSALTAALTLLLSLVTSPADSSAVSFVSFHKNDGVHGQSSTSYGVQHGPAGQGAARVGVLQGNTLGPTASGLPPSSFSPGRGAARVGVLQGNTLGPTASGLPPSSFSPGQGQPLLEAPIQPLFDPADGLQLGDNRIAGAPLALTGESPQDYIGSQADLMGLEGTGALVGASGPVGARLVRPGGALDSPLDGPLTGPLDGPVVLSDPGPGLVRLRDDPANRVGINGQAPVKDSLPRPALRTITGTPVWMPSYSRDPPSYEK